ncbi:MAG: hypothetical protein ACOX45_07010 [Acutalibacteraceae bacterium]
MKDNNYFYITIHFQPCYENKTLQKIDETHYKHMKTDRIYRKRLMYDWGWGQEYGFEQQPPLTFAEVIQIVIDYKKSIISYSQKHMNFVGAVSVIMQDHVEELIDFLSKKINTDYFANSEIRENFKWFAFSSQKTREAGKIPGGILTQSYEDVLNQYPKWREISSQVIGKIYT